MVMLYIYVNVYTVWWWVGCCFGWNC